MNKSLSSIDKSWHLPLLNVLDKSFSLATKVASTPGTAQASAVAAFLVNPLLPALVIPVLIALQYHAERGKEKRSSSKTSQLRKALLDPIKAAYQMLAGKPEEIARTLREEGIDTATPLLILFKELQQNGGKIDGLDAKLTDARKSLAEIKATFKSGEVRLGDLDTSLKTDIKTCFEALRKTVTIEISNLPKSLAPAFRDLETSLDSALQEIKQLQIKTLETVEHIAEKMECGPSSAILTREMLDDYASAIQRRYRTPELLAIRQSADAVPFSLIDIFIEPRLRMMASADPRALEMPAEEAKELDRQYKAAGDRTTQEELDHLHTYFRERPPISAFQMLDHWEKPGQILFSGAGGGKSALLQYLSLRWAQLWQETHDPDQAGPVPLLIELRRYASARNQDHSLDFRKFIATSQDFPSPLPSPAVAAALQNGKARLLLDGLDEILDTVQRRDVACNALDLIGKGCPVLITSRIFGFDPKPWHGEKQLDTHLIPAFEDDQRDLFIAKAHQLLAPDLIRRENLDRSLRQRLQTLPHFRELADNPLLLTLLVLVTANHATIETRSDLYEEASKLLLDQWESNRFGQSQQPTPSAIEPLQYSTRRAILGHLAWSQLHRPADQPANLFPMADVEVAIRAGAKALTKSSLDYHLVNLPKLLRERHNVLCFRGGEQFSFVHRTFLEYFAARQLHDLATELELRAPEIYKKHLLPHLRDERWQEPLRLYFSLTDKTKVAKLIELLLETEPEGDETQKLRNPAALLLAAEAFHDTRQDTRSAELARKISDKAATFLLGKGTKDYSAFVFGHGRNAPQIRLTKALVQLDHFLGQPLERWKVPKNGRIFKDYGSDTPLSVAIEELGRLLGKEARFQDYLEGLILDKEEDITVRRAAIETIGEIHAGDPRIRQLFEKRILDRADNFITRANAIVTITLTYGSDPTVRCMLETLLQNKQEDLTIRRQSAISLGKIHVKAFQFRRLLEKIVRDNEDMGSIRIASLNTILAYHGLDSALKEIVKCQILNKAEPAEVRKHSISAFDTFSGRKTEFQNILKKLIRDKSDEGSVRAEAIKMLSQKTGIGVSFRLLLIEIIKDKAENFEVRKQAVWTAGILHGKEEEVRGLLEFLVYDMEDDEGVRRQAVDVFGLMDRNEPSFRQMLEILLANRKENPMMRIKAEVILKQLYGDDPSILRMIGSVADDPTEDEQVRESAKVALGRKSESSE